MKAKELYCYFQDYSGDFGSYWEPETDYDDVPDIMAVLEEIERHLMHAADEVVRMTDPELSEEVRCHADRALSDLRYVRDALDILEVMKVLDEGEGDDLFWNILGRLSWGEYTSLISFWTQTREETEKAD